MMYRTGKLYSGEWLNGVKQGNGIMQYANGDFYEGQWYKDLRHGFGKLQFYRAGEFYEGEWNNDMMNGKGIFRTEKEAYEGVWKDNDCIEKHFLKTYEKHYQPPRKLHTEQSDNAQYNRQLAIAYEDNKKVMRHDRGNNDVSPYLL